MHTKIQLLEKQLLTAMELGDIQTLERLLHHDLLFTLPTGQTVTREMDIDNYINKRIHIDKIQVNGQKIQLMGGTAIVVSSLELKGEFQGNSINGDYSYLRVWMQFGASWKVIAGSGHRL